MFTYFASLILTVALIAPSVAQESRDGIALPEIKGFDPYVLEAPKAPFLSFNDYAVLVAEEAGVNPAKFKALITCESQWKEDASGDKGTSLGILQFKKPTFELFSKKYGFKDADIDNPYHQIDLAAQMIKNGYLNHWKNCARKIGWRFSV